jgi:uncharacterized phage protein (TIGR02218 family)
MTAAIAQGPLTSLAFCWRIERRDGAGLALTSHDNALLIGGETFRAAPGIVPSAIIRSAGLEPHSGEVAGALTSDALNEQDLGLGRWDAARVAIFAVDWTEPEGQQIALIGGELGEVSVEGEQFSAELHGAARLAEPVCPETSPECRAEFGDKKCRVDLAGRTVRRLVVSSAGAELVIDQALDDRFMFGRARFMGGANCGVASTIIGIDGAEIHLRDVPRMDVESGTVIELREGCDKRFATCVERFDNAVNFRGEPHLPGNDLLTRYPGA